MVLPHAEGEGPTMRWHWFILTGRHILLGRAWRSWYRRRFTELGGWESSRLQGELCHVAFESDRVRPCAISLQAL